MTARARTALLALALVGVSAAFTGCGTLVSRNEYLNTALGEEPKHVGLHAEPSGAIAADSNDAKPAA